MHAGRRYTFFEALYWSRRHLYVALFLALIPVSLFEVFGVEIIAIPWVPVAMLGTAAAFLAGFRNNATYNRAWEARQIYGGIVNTSRSWGIMSRDFVSKQNAGDAEHQKIHQQLIYRHIAWLTALRYQLREPRTWENMSRPENVEYRTHFNVVEQETKMDDELKKYLSATEFDTIIKNKNKATQILAHQSAELKRLYDAGFIENNHHVELELLLKEFYDHQGKCERIKNFPYPRQFASINLYFIRLFVIMVPFGMLNEFDKLGDNMVWLTIPMSALVCWVFLTLESIGESTENPFEGGSNDVPITALSRTIEIDLREMLGETELPPPIQPKNNILM